jgi:hypothetical protein
MTMKPTLAIFLFCFVLSFVQSEETAEPRRVLFFAGQSREEFASYLKDVTQNGKKAPFPAGATFYTSLTLSGIDRPHANVRGDNHQDLWYLSQFKQPLLIQVALWMSPEDLKQVHRGQVDRNIQELGKKLNELKRPVFLRIGYEFDGPHNNYPPQDYIKAYRKIAIEMRKYEQISLVWHSFALLDTFQKHDVMAWYPGDDVVDWIGISYFQVTEEGYFRKPNRDRLLEIAREKKLPVFISEASALRFTQRQQSLTGQDYWDYWYKPYIEFIRAHPEVKAASIIHVDWDSQQQHAFLKWGDSQLHTDKVILKNWLLEMKQPYWQFSTRNLYTQTQPLLRGPTDTPPQKPIP